MWDLPGPGLEPVSPALVGGFSTTAPPEKPLQRKLLKVKIWSCHFRPQKPLIYSNFYPLPTPTFIFAFFSKPDILFYTSMIIPTFCPLPGVLFCPFVASKMKSLNSPCSILYPSSDSLLCLASYFIHTILAVTRTQPSNFLFICLSSLLESELFFGPDYIWFIFLFPSA